MQAYVSYEDFLSEGGVTAGADQPTVERLLRLSSMNADYYCEQHLGDLLDDAEPYQREYVRLAVIYNTNSLLAQGEGVYNGVDGGSNDIASYSTLENSVTYKTDNRTEAATLTTLSRAAKDFLIRSGFCLRRLGR